jgi:hypothetical protein
MLKGLSDYDLVQFSIPCGGISLLTAFIHCCNTARPGYVVSLCSRISLCFDSQLFKAIVSFVVVARTGYCFSSIEAQLLFVSSFQIPLQCNYLLLALRFQISFRYWYTRTHNYWKCKQLLGITACTNLRTWRLISVEEWNMKRSCTTTSTGVSRNACLARGSTLRRVWPVYFRYGHIYPQWSSCRMRSLQICIGYGTSFKVRSCYSGNSENNGIRRMNISSALKLGLYSLLDVYRYIFFNIVGTADFFFRFRDRNVYKYGY